MGVSNVTERNAGSQRSFDLMIPDAPQGKPIAFFDTECYRNYWLLKFRPRGAAAITIELHPGQTLASTGQVERVLYLFGIFTVVSFNGNTYDSPMIAGALNGYEPMQLKWLSDKIIVEEVKPWEIEEKCGVPRWEPPDHIDVMEVAPGAGSQKQFVGRIHFKTMRDLPYEPDATLTDEQIANVAQYCENDLDGLEFLFDGLRPQIAIRESMSAKYRMDLRSKSDAQLGESIIKRLCELATNTRLYKNEPDWNLRFRYEVPAWIQFQTPVLREALETIRNSIFQLGPSGGVVMPPQLEGLQIPLGHGVYRMGIGGLHSSETRKAYRANAEHIIRDVDVASYYPNLIVNSGKYPAALGPVFTRVYVDIITERLAWKKKQRVFEKQGVKVKDPASGEGYEAYSGNEGLKIAINGSFGKLGSPYSILFAPEMLIQTTVTGQLALLMLIELHELNGIKVISANTDGVVIYCPRNLLTVSDNIIEYWQKVSGLELEPSEYAAIYSRDVNNYFAIKTDGEVKRKGAYSKSGLVEKKNPSIEICGDAVADFLSKGVPVEYSIAACRDIRKFFTVRQVNGGAIKLWGEGPRKDFLVKDMIPVLESNGWSKSGRQWTKNGSTLRPREAYETCFLPQRREYIGKVIRWYYSTRSPGSIVYKTTGNTVGMSYDAMPCMTLPDAFPEDVNHDWYINTSNDILEEIGYNDAH